MEIETLAWAFEREHREVDAGIAAFTAGSPPPSQDALARAIRALRRHIYLEEEFLFPLLYQADKALAASLSVMLREHAQIWAMLDLLDTEPDARAGIAVCKRLTTQLLHHNLTEERVLYPRADDLPAPAVGRLRALLETADLPEGWLCTKARPAASGAGS